MTATTTYPSLSNLPDEVSPDGSCFIHYTRDKSGRIVAAHCCPMPGETRRPSRVLVVSTSRRCGKSMFGRLIRGQSPLQRIQSLFA